MRRDLCDICVDNCAACPQVVDTKVQAPEAWGDQKMCPFCGCGYVHFYKPEYRDVEFESWAGRGEAIEIEFWCEEGCRWKELTGFHKGNTFTKVTKKEINIQSELSLLLDMVIVACENSADNAYPNQAELTKIQHKLEGIIFYED